MKHLLIALLAAATLSAQTQFSTIAVDKATYAPNFPFNQKNIPLAIDRLTGQLITSSTGGGGGGGGDASAANQVTGNNLLTSIDGKSTSFLTSSANSSTSPLGGAGVFTGTSEDVSAYATIAVVVFSDQVSAVDGLSLQQSTNGTNWDVLDVFSVPANQGKTFSLGVSARFFRVVYTNGATPQGAFRLLTSYHRYATKPSTVRPQDGRTNDNDSEEVVAYNSVYNPTSQSWDRARGDSVNGAYVQQIDNYVTGQGTQTAVGQNILLATAGTAASDLSGMRWISIQITPTGTVSGGVVTFEGSNDNVNFSAIFLAEQASTALNPASGVTMATGVTRFFHGGVSWRYFRARISTVVSGGGSLQAFSRMSPATFVPPAFTVVQQTPGNLLMTASGTVVTAPSVIATDNTMTRFRNAALTNTAVAVKASAGNLYALNVINVNTTPVYLKFYNIAQGTVVVGTSTIFATYAVPAGDGTSPGVMVLLPSSAPLGYLSTAITVAVVTGIADNSTTAPTTPILLEAQYK